MHSRLYSKLKSLRGFTLIELLIVIAIIGILTVAFLPTLRGGQASARNAARKATLNDLVNAIELISTDALPPGTTITAATRGRLYSTATNGLCLNFSNGFGADIRAVLGRAPAVNTSGVQLCTGTGESGVFYKTYDDSTLAGPGTTSLGAATNAVHYILATQVEGNTADGNYSGTGNTVLTGFTSAGGEVNTQLNNWQNVLDKTTGTPTSKLWVVSH